MFRVQLQVVCCLPSPVVCEYTHTASFRLLARWAVVFMWRQSSWNGSNYLSKGFYVLINAFALTNRHKLVSTISFDVDAVVSFCTSIPERLMCFDFVLY